MTIDFSSDRITVEAGGGALSPAAEPVAVAPLPPRAPVPSQPSLHEVASLVRELFSEGTLSWDQLSELARVPELKNLLEDAMAGVPAGRRLLLPHR